MKEHLWCRVVQDPLHPEEHVLIVKYDDGMNPLRGAGARIYQEYDTGKVEEIWDKLCEKLKKGLK